MTLSDCGLSNLSLNPPVNFRVSDQEQEVKKFGGTVPITASKGFGVGGIINEPLDQHMARLSWFGGRCVYNAKLIKLVIVNNRFADREYYRHVSYTLWNWRDLRDMSVIHRSTTYRAKDAPSLARTKKNLSYFFAVG